MTKRKVVQPDLIDVLLADYKKTAVQSLTRLIERARRLHENGADSHRLRQYVQRWVTWLHGGLAPAPAACSIRRWLLCFFMHCELCPILRCFQYSFVGSERN
jgi:hypothetical protein